jgi:hypothetical protein
MHNVSAAYTMHTRKGAYAVHMGLSSMVQWEPKIRAPPYLHTTEYVCIPTAYDRSFFSGGGGNNSRKKIRARPYLHTTAYVCILLHTTAYDRSFFSGEKNREKIHTVPAHMYCNTTAYMYDCTYDCIHPTYRNVKCASLLALGGAEGAAGLARVALARHEPLDRVRSERTQCCSQAKVAAARADARLCIGSTAGWVRRRRRKQATANVAASLPCEHARARIASPLRTGERAREPCLAALWLQQHSVVGEAAVCARWLLGGPPHAAQTFSRSRHARRGRKGARQAVLARPLHVPRESSFPRCAVGGGMADGGMRCATAHTLPRGLSCTGQGWD